jgi:vesicle-fusing ATPase
VNKPDAGEQELLWQQALGQTVGRLNGSLDGVASQFRLSAHSILSAGMELQAALRASDRPDATLWSAVRSLGRPKLDDLAQRIEPAAGWNDLILPEPQKSTLRQIAAHARYRLKVYGDWGFAGNGPRGLGISALFAGESGTGKTMAAEVIAGSLGLDLYRIDLSALVSKFIGETEKHLSTVFDAAEASGAVLLFDEADALFGKRSDVKDSHDRYANLEVAYLLQRMDSYRGLAILTTNLRGNVDRAFLRRIRFVVQFPFPDETSRAEIWRRVFPAATPLADVDPAALARIQLSGGAIRQIALSAAFAAADEGVRVGPAHLLRAATREAAKSERALTAVETSALRGGVA